MDVRQLEAVIGSTLSADTNVAAIYLFGSRARGTSRADSDVDIGVLYRAAPLPTLLGQPFEQQTQLGHALGLRVDLVVMNTAPVDLVHRILRDGRILLEADRSRRIAFEVQARNKYFDLLPILRRYRGGERMTDEELVQKKLAFIETCLHELRTMAKLSLLESDLKERRFVEHTLQICLQATQDVASHIVSDEKLGEPATNLELFTLLARAGWLEEPQARSLRAAIGFRNVVVHGYSSVNPDIIVDIVENHLGDIVAFVAAVRARLGSTS